MDSVPTEVYDDLALELLHYPLKKKQAEVCHTVLTAYGSRQQIDVRYLTIIRELAKRKGCDAG